MSTTFPTSIDSYSTKVDGVDDVLASHVNNLQDAVVAIETFIGAGGLSLSQGVRVFNSAALTIGTGAWTTLTFNSESYDAFGMHSTSSNTGRLTAQRAGVYGIFGSLQFSPSAGGTIRGLRFLVNGSVSVIMDLRSPNGATTTVNFGISAFYPLAAGDYVEMQVYQDSGGNLNVDRVSAYSPEFGMQQVGF